MTQYEPGTVAIATVRGVPDVRVFRYEDVYGRTIRWDSARPIEEVVAHPDETVTDIRPLVVLDVDRFVTPELLVTWLRQNDVCGSHAVAAEIADQIEAQTKPRRIPEPGLWGLVTAHTERKPDRRTFGRIPDPNDAMQWTDEGDNWWDWDDLIDPVLIREGVES